MFQVIFQVVFVLNQTNSHSQGPRSYNHFFYNSAARKYIAGINLRSAEGAATSTWSSTITEDSQGNGVK